MREMENELKNLKLNLGEISDQAAITKNISKK